MGCSIHGSKNLSSKHLKKNSTGGQRREAFYECSWFALPPRKNVYSPRRLFPYQACEVVTGLGVMELCTTDEQAEMFHQKYPQLKGKKGLLYLGRFHPKKGGDDLIRAWKNREKSRRNLVLAGPWKKALAGLNFEKFGK